ncbi:hypothetical protein NLL52_28050, partial [Klebsiella pneumoniae]|nr:hypothetical protein [Klebsiella pneumoniae]
MAFSRTHSLLARAGSTSTYKRVWRYWYPLMTRGLGNDEIVFINWAYEEDPPMDLPLEASDEPKKKKKNLTPRRLAVASSTCPRPSTHDHAHVRISRHLMRLCA